MAIKRKIRRGKLKNAIEEDIRWGLYGQYKNRKVQNPQPSTRNPKRKTHN